jgi:fructose-1-phosphate kinase PfkB-like protein
MVYGNLFFSSFEYDAKNITGAGDCWDTANIFVYLSNLQPSERLQFSNTYASLYIVNPELELPSLNEVIKFLENM